MGFFSINEVLCNRVLSESIPLITQTPTPSPRRSHVTITPPLLLFISTVWSISEASERRDVSRDRKIKAAATFGGTGDLRPLADLHQWWPLYYCSEKLPRKVPSSQVVCNLDKFAMLLRHEDHAKIWIRRLLHLKLYLYRDGAALHILTSFGF